MHSGIQTRQASETMDEVAEVSMVGRREVVIWRGGGGGQGVSGCRYLYTSQLSVDTGGGK